MAVSIWGTMTLWKSRWVALVVVLFGVSCASEMTALDDVAEVDDSWDDPYEQFDPIPGRDGSDSAVIDAEGKRGVCTKADVTCVEEENYRLENFPHKALFLESFQGPWPSRWRHSENEKYNGVFSVGGGAQPSITGDRGLIVTKKGQFYGICTEAHVPDPSDDTLVVQFEVWKNTSPPPPVDRCMRTPPRRT